MSIRISTTVTAWSNIVNLGPHKRRRQEVVFDGKTFRLIPHGVSANGLSSFLINFLLRPSNSFDQSNYSSEPPHYILPETFVDQRPDSIKDIDYEFLAPGVSISTLDPEFLFQLLHHPRETPYTTWGDPTDDITNHVLEFPRSLLPHISRIVDYWHISSPGGRYPRSSVEQASAFLNALGHQQLTHDLLLPPEPKKPKHFSDMDVTLNKMKLDAEKRKAKVKK